MARIAIGGWQHETNTFATIRVDYQSFISADEWPGIQQGDSLVDGVREVHLPITGAIQALEESGHEIVPLLWCSATPCSYVTREAFEKIADRMIELLEQSLPVDGIYLDLHGAMVAEHLQDGEGEILSRMRDTVGPEIPIFVSLDLHANVTPKMVQHATVLDIFRTYPHIDMGETGYRIARYLCDHIETPSEIHKAYAQIDFLIPLNTGCTLIEPCQTLYSEMPDLLSDSVSSISFACGFHLSDIFDVGPAVVAYGRDQEQVNQAVQTLITRINASKKNFHEKIWPAEEGVAEAKRCLEKPGNTVVMADTQDNPGGGGAGDTVGVLKAMIKHNLGNAVFGVINDKWVAAAAHAAGIGNIIDIDLGGKAGIEGQETLACNATVINLSDGRFIATGPMYKGAHMELGATTLLEISGIKVVVCSRAVQTADQAHFRHLGIDPSEFDFVAVKSSVHFRNDYQQMATTILILSSPGEVYADPSTLTYSNIRSGVELTRMS
jgi:microcystin degradation protein MlrC